MRQIPTLNLRIPLEDYILHYKFQLENTKDYRLNIKEKDNQEIKTEKLFKFYFFNTNNIDSLHNSYFYLASPKDFNDPFDCQNHQEELMQKKYPIRKDIFDNLGVSCFTRNSQNPSMWDRYTDKYSGYCIKFKNINLFDRTKIDIRSNVAYTSKYFNIEWYYQEIFKEIDHQKISENSKNDMKFIITIGHKYCQKSTDWKNEEEYRIVSLRCKENLRKIYYDPSQIEELYLGYNMIEENKKIILDVIKAKGINPKIFVVKPSTIHRKLILEDCNSY